VTRRLVRSDRTNGGVERTPLLWVARGYPKGERTVTHVCDSHPPNSRPWRLPGRRGQGDGRWPSPPTLLCQSMQVPTITDSASASGKANPSTLFVRWLKARSDHGQRTSTTRCTWTDSPRSSEDNRLIPADPIRSQARSADWVPPYAGMPGRRSAFGNVPHDAHAQTL
jgi:hypothetical protein